MKRLIILVLLLVPSAFAAGGACPTGANYVALTNPQNGGGLGSVTLSSLGVTICYYVSSTGADTNTGIDKAHSWLHAPGMPACANTCAATTLVAGNGVIFRGGDTWHRSSGSPATGGAWTLPSSGSGGSPIYWGVDLTWFSGGSFARPTFSQDNPLSTSTVGSCSFADDGTTFLSTGSTSFNIVDGFEFTGNCQSGSGVGSIINPISATSFTTERLYIHGWTSTAGVGDDAGVKIGNNSNSTSNTSNRHLFDVIDGADSTFGASCNATSCLGTGHASGWAFGDGYDIEYSVIRHVSNGIQAGNVCNLIGNLMEYQFEPSLPGGRHGNVMEANFGSACTTMLAYNNVTRNTNTGVNWWPLGGTYYIFNNVWINSGHVFGSPPVDPNGLMLSGLGTTGFTVVHANLYNNTFQSNKVQAPVESGTTPGWAGGSTIVWENNHIMDFTSTPSFFTCGAGNTCTPTENGGEVFQTTAAANAQGYTFANTWAPTAPTNSTVGAGLNTATFCAGLPNSLATAACQSGTSQAVTEVSGWGGQLAQYPAIAVNARPISGAEDSGAYQSVTFSIGCTSTLAIPPPSIAPFAGLTGAGTYVPNPEPANFHTYGCFGLNNPILRVSDGNTPPAACAAQGTSCNTKANQVMVINNSDGEDFQWSCFGTGGSCDQAQFSTEDGGSTFYIWDFHGMSLPATVRYTNNPNHVLKMFTLPTASHVTPRRFYSLANTLGNATGTVLASYDTSQAWPILPTRSILYDFTSSANGVPLTATNPTDPVNSNATDTRFLTGFSTSPSQGTGAYVTSYTIGSGVSVWNTLTGVVTGDFGSTGTVACQNCPGGAANPGQFLIHNVKPSLDAAMTYAVVAVQNGTCVGTCYNGSDPYLWQIGTNKVWILCLGGSGHCSGHFVVGATSFINQFNPPYFIQKALPGNTGTTFPTSPNCLASASPIMDQHASWHNDNSTDTLPFWVSTTATSGGSSANPVYNACNVSEIDSLDPPTIGDNKIFRAGHNYGAAVSDFATQNQLSTVSPDGKYMLMTSPMAVPPSYLGQLGDTGGNQPCALAVNCRGDVFVMQLSGAPSIPLTPDFGFTETNTAPSNFPTTTGYGMQRIWDSPPLQWPSINTAVGVFTYTALDTMLAQDYTNNVREVMYTLARTPPWATSQPTDTTCHYQLPAVGGGPGECFAPSDLNADGSGTNATWKAWITSIATHANNPIYLQTHAHIRYWEVWNEPDAAFYWSGSFAQLARLTEDANCIITGRGVVHQFGNGTATACTATPIDPTAVIVMASGHADSPAALKYAQNQLYCNNTSGIPAYQLPCPNPANATATAIDVVNFHMKPGNAYPATLENTFANYVTMITGILQSTETIKPLWDGEMSYATSGFPAPYNDPDMGASVCPRIYLTGLTQGVTGTAWYTSDNIAAQSGKVATSCKQTIAYLAGSSLTVPCTATGSVYSCTITQNGVQHLILWDNAQTCSAGSCTTGNVVVGSQWVLYQDMTSVSTPIAISANTVPVGIKAIILSPGVVFPLTVTIVGTGSVTSVPSGISCPAACTASFASGTAVTLTATPSGGFVFSGWSGACSGISACSVTMSGIQSVTALFVPSSTTAPAPATNIMVQVVKKESSATLDGLNGGSQ